MNSLELLPSVRRLFPARGPRTTRVAVEHELVAVDAFSGGVVDTDWLLAATSGAAYAHHLTFEPGGQVELSLLPVHDAAALAAQLTSTVNDLRWDCALAGIDLRALPVDDRALEVPRQLRSPRYAAMEAHFDTIGPAGRRMMRRTASTQICLDWWPGAAGLEQWRVLNLAAPFLAAQYARSSGPAGRLATWLEVDPSRTAFDGRLLHGDDPVRAYADFAAGATQFVGDGEHLSTLFPPIRPRGTYLEVRFLDVQEPEALEEIVTTLASLLYDDAHRRAELHRLESHRESLAAHWAAAAAGALALEPAA